MPLLLCPNDNTSMNTISRNGVEFDMCPTCRGVWLDRGELENLMASQGGGAGQSSPSIPTQPPRYEEPRRYDRDHHDRYKRKKRDSIFDIFD
ncbi:MAG: zf-TFIIB domain-containing protein [Brevundimonas sp.]|uniref:TFIIB-type zinc ribbon-containing protein n=1 Tax=Brevundimonas sp. TaxID=1871086 RepID=UPI002AB99CEE|nr:zf-TFIIB domain-containing protein [Brevundimonas sp.]MDZ4113264.1 zf-TFIIB domain-containing protein [Brevundimonas sp.]